MNITEYLKPSILYDRQRLESMGFVVSIIEHEIRRGELRGSLPEGVQFTIGGGDLADWLRTCGKFEYVLPAWWSLGVDKPQVIHCAYFGRAAADSEHEGQTDATLASLERIARAVFPSELAGRPLYLMWAHDLPSEFVALNDVLAMTGGTLDLALKPHLGSRWAGRGRAIVFNADMHFRWYDEDSLTAGLHQSNAHELAHFAVDGLPSESSSEIAGLFAEAQLKMSLGAFEPIAHERLQELGAADGPLDEFFGHDARFWRALVHVNHRAIAAGAEFDPDAEFRKYGLNSFDAYSETLASEIEALADLPLVAALRTTEPDEAFTTLFETDVARVRGVNL